MMAKDRRAVSFLDGSLSIPILVGNKHGSLSSCPGAITAAPAVLDKHGVNIFIGGKQAPVKESEGDGEIIYLLIYLPLELNVSF